MKTIKVNDQVFIHCKDKALYDYIKANYVDEVTNPENEEFLDELQEMAGEDGVVHAYLDYDTSVEEWFVDHVE